MNLVAKEFIAAQDPDDPGVLVLSRFAGAAEQLTSSVIVNPYDRTQMAEGIAEALAMPLDERRARHAEARASVWDEDIAHWARTFLRALDGASDVGRLAEAPPDI
jgi:trehalose 6-phosphate synthase